MKLFKIKPADTDYSDSMLPTNRKEVFFDVFKLHWRSLFLLGLVVALFAVPFIFIQISGFFATMNIQDEEGYETAVVLVSNITSLIKVPVFILLGIVLAGVIRIIRQFCWMENVTLSYDFFLGIKQNIRQTIVLLVLVGVFWYLSVYCLNISYISQNTMKYALALPIGLFVLVIMPIAGYTMVAIATYNNKFSQNVKIAFLVYASNPFKAILCTCLCSFIFVFKVISIISIQLICEVIGFVILPISLLGFFLFANKQFDKQINKHYYPELVGKGLRLE